MRFWLRTGIFEGELGLRSQSVARGRWLEYGTIAYNSLEGLVALVAGWLAGSIALEGFGFDSIIEVSSGAALLLRLHADADPRRRARMERLTLEFVGVCFLALAAYVSYNSLSNLIRHDPPRPSIIGIALAATSLTVMPLLARAKRRVAREISSGAMAADAKQTEFCMYLSAILLVGLTLNAAFGWWWADPLAGFIMVPIIAREGIGALRGRTCECSCHESCE
jgi:divalent metal cation (Fe/Co/Zn/Cd) transporter